MTPHKSNTPKTVGIKNFFSIFFSSLKINLKFLYFHIQSIDSKYVSYNKKVRLTFAQLALLRIIKLILFVTLLCYCQSLNPLPCPIFKSWFSKKSLFINSLSSNLPS